MYAALLWAPRWYLICVFNVRSRGYVVMLVLPLQRSP